MKKALIVANMLFASAAVWGMNESLVNQENSGNVFVKVEDLSKHEQGIRARAIKQICKLTYSSGSSREINDNLEAAVKSLSGLDVLGLPLSYKNKEPLADQQIKNLMVNPRILNSVDQDGNTLLSYTIKSFFCMAHVGGGDEWDASWNREGLLLLSSYMLEHGGDPFLKMSGKNGPFMKRIKDHYLNWYLSEGEYEALGRLLSTYEEVKGGLVETKDLSECERYIRAQIIEQVREASYGTSSNLKKVNGNFMTAKDALIQLWYKLRFKKINDNFETAKDALSSPDVLVLQNEKPSTSQKINPRILNSVDQDGNTLLSYIIKSFYNLIKSRNKLNALGNGEKLLLLSKYMLDHGANPFLKMSDENGPFIEQIKDHDLNRCLSENESDALRKLLSSYKEAVKNWKIV